MQEENTENKPSVIQGYILVNAEKVNRAINGAIGQRGQLVGGVGEEASEQEKLAEYDRLGGLVMKGKYKIKMGSFYDFKKRAPRAKPEVLLSLTDIYGNTIDLPEDQPLPVEVQAAEMIKEQKIEKAKTAKVTKKSKKADDAVDEDEE